MKRNLKTLFVGTLLALVMVTGVLAVPSVAESADSLVEVAEQQKILAEITQSGTCGTNLTWTLDSDGTLTISGSGEMTNWSYSSNAPWYSSRSSIKKVVIGDGVTSIGAWAFSWCTSLTSVVIPDSVTSMGENAFYKCSSLTSVDIPDSVENIGNYAFDWCSSLTSVEIGDSVTSIGECAFYCYYSLTSITVDENNRYYSNDERGVLFNKDKTTLIQYPAGNTATTYEIPNRVESIGEYAFYYCTSLTSITVDENNGYYSSDERGVLFNKNKTTLIQYPIGNTATTYEIPDSVTSIGDEAFYYCRSLTSIEIPDSVTSIGNYAFEDCTSLTSVDIPDSVTSIGSYAFSFTSLTSIEIPDSVTSIGEGAFYWCRSLTSIEIPDSVTSIGYEAFYNCPNLTIYGYTGSYAETYANNNSIPFVALTNSIPGDINGDDKFDYYDVSRLYAFYRGKTTLDEGIDTDINRDGKFDYYDVARLYAIYRGKASFN